MFSSGLNASQTTESIGSETSEAVAKAAIDQRDACRARHRRRGGRRAAARGWRAIERGAARRATAVR